MIIRFDRPRTCSSPQPTTLPNALTPTHGAVSVPISGSGSQSNALYQLLRDAVNQDGKIPVSFAANGAASGGRNDFRAGQVDFAVSEIPYGLTGGGVLDPKPARPFGYMPILAGGPTFIYNLKSGNKRVTNLRLSGENLTKIFTRVITNWGDPAIQADNPGLILPTRPIVPVVHSDSAATNLQSCNNPTFSPNGTDLLTKNAPQPQPCDFKGATQCATGTGGAAGPPTPTPTPTSSPTLPPGITDTTTTL